MLELGLKVFITYLIGSMNGALLVGLMHGGVDIRRAGSGNAGATNALRTQGIFFAALVMVFDVAKGFLPVMFLPALTLPEVVADPAVSREWLTYSCAGAAVFGHCYPVWHEFAGGKGFATALGVLAAISPVVLLPVLVTWVVILLVVGYVGVATVVSAFSIPAYLLLTDWPGNRDMFLFTFLLALFIAYTHRANLKSFLGGAATPDIRFSLLRRSD